MTDAERAERVRIIAQREDGPRAALCESSMRERISCEMATMDVDALNALYLEALAIRQWGPSGRATIVVHHKRKRRDSWECYTSIDWECGWLRPGRAPKVRA